MIDDGKLKIYAHATVDETKQNWANSDFVELDKPDLIVTVSHCLSIQYNPEITVLKGPANFDLYWRELLLVGDYYDMIC